MTEEKVNNSEQAKQEVGKKKLFPKVASSEEWKQAHNMNLAKKEAEVEEWEKKYYAADVEITKVEGDFKQYRIDSEEKIKQLEDKVDELEKRELAKKKYRSAPTEDQEIDKFKKERINRFLKKIK
ncbi:MAG: hypothetical protein MRERV_16c030 [Mycoplasmataceae bacterium RV_VA103A]|nr:MAG: hypothetical protein MRERV_16c030 [Mycoplasmataceae bacterium RV_VA103A]